MAPGPSVSKRPPGKAVIKGVFPKDSMVCIRVDRGRVIGAEVSTSDRTDSETPVRSELTDADRNGDAER